MTRGRKIKITLLVLLLLIIIGGAVGYIMWNKPHPKAEDQKGSAVTAATLYSAFTNNEAAANATYLNKVLVVSGIVAEVSKNQDGKVVAILDTGDPMGGIQCTLREEAELKPGQTINVKGFCNGFTMVVILNDCVLE